MIFKDDISVNRSNTKGLLFIVSYRLFTIIYGFLSYKYLGVLRYLFCFPYIAVVQWIMGIDIPLGTKIGRGFQLYHGQGVVINRHANIGAFVKIRQGVTIGNSIKNGNSPCIGNNVSIGPNVVIIGDVTIGCNSVISAMSLVNKSFDSNSVIGGVPAKVL